jgi:hypothetical protein
MPHPGDFFHQTFLYHMVLNGIEMVRERTKQPYRAPGRTNPLS